MPQTNTTRATRSEDTSGTLLEVACLSATEGAETRLWQRVHIADPVTPTQHLLIDTNGNITASAYVFAGGQLAVSAQISAGGILSAQLSATGALSAAISNQPTVSAQLSASDVVSASVRFLAGQIVSAQLSATAALSAAISNQPTVSAQLSATALLSAWDYTPALPGGVALSAVAFEVSATSAILGLSATYRTFIYGIRLTSEASGGWHRWIASGGAVSAYDGFQRADTFGGYVMAVTPPAYLYMVSASASFALQQSSTVSALAGTILYWRQT